MAGLGKHLRGHRKERVIGDTVSHKPIKRLSMPATGDMKQPDMTSPVHPDLASMAGGPSGPSNVGSANADISSSGMSAPSAPSGGSPMGLKKGGIAKGQKSTTFESGKSKNKPYEAEEAYAKEEGGYKKGGRAHYAEGSKNWIKGAIKHPGSLRKSLHVKEGQKIPAKKLEAASHKSGKMGQRARLAKTLRSFKS
jgi:hypothetical protein